MGPHPAVAAIRLAVRRVLHDVLDSDVLHHDGPGRPAGLEGSGASGRPGSVVSDAPTTRQTGLAGLPAPAAARPPGLPAHPPVERLSSGPRVPAGRATATGPAGPVAGTSAAQPPAAEGTRAPDAPLARTGTEPGTDVSSPADTGAAAPAPATAEGTRTPAAPPARTGSEPDAGAPRARTATEPGPDASVPAAEPGTATSPASGPGPTPGTSPTPGDDRPLVLVACSGGADSMALASALAFEARKLPVRAGAVTVDHGLQPGSDLRAAEVAQRLRDLGLDPVEAVTVTVGRAGGPEAAARDARYAALDEAAERLGAAAVLLGHTRDDQAETVLLGLARGSGIRSLSGMAAVSGAAGRYRRPFLQLDRQTARKACLVQSLPVWDDPMNADPAYTRSRLRHEGLPALEKSLGKGVVEALARTAQLCRDDADALDAWAADADASVRDESGRLDCAKLYALPPAVRRRVLRRAAVQAGAPAGSLFARHVEEMDRLITGWRGQGALNLPGRVAVRRQGGRLVIRQG